MSLADAKPVAGACVPEVPKEGPAEVTALLTSELDEILRRTHWQLQTDLLLWLNQRLRADSAAVSAVVQPTEGCSGPFADVAFPALETRAAKSSGLGSTLPGDGDQAPESDLPMSSLQLPFGGAIRQVSDPSISKTLPLAMDQSCDLVSMHSSRRSRWAVSEDEDLQRAKTRTSVQEPDTSKASKSKAKRPNRCRKMIEDPWFDRVFAFMIIASSVAVGAEVEYTAVAMTNELPVIFGVLQVVFFLAFLTELLIRLAAFRLNFFYAFDAGWNIFDLIVVLFSGIELIAAYLFVNNHPFLTIVRMIRVVRFARIIRVVRFLRQLRVMVYTLFGTLPSLFWSAVLMAIILYLFATMLTQAVLEYLMLQQGTLNEEQDRLRDVFGTTARTVYFLFQAVSGGTNWARDVDLLFQLEIIYVFVFIIYVMVTAFALLNVVTGFFCESAIEMAAADREQMVVEMLREKEKLIKEFQHVFDEIDVNQSGEIELEELEEFLGHDSMQAYLSHLHISTSGAWNIFKLLDKDKTGSVTIEEFVEGLLSLKGLSKTIDIATLQYDLKKMSAVWRDFMEYVEQEFQKLETRLPEPTASVPQL